MVQYTIGGPDGFFGSLTATICHKMFAEKLAETHTHAHTPFNGPLSRTTRVILLKQETVSGSGISWAVCKSAPRSCQITTPAPHHSIFTGQMPFLPPNQERQSTEGFVLLLLVNMILRH